MPPRKRGPLFRVEGLPGSKTNEQLCNELRPAIQAKFRSKKETPPSFDIEIVPSCYDNGRDEAEREKVALVQFESAVPSAVGMQIIMDNSNLLLDSQFHCLTQLYALSAGVKVSADIVAIAGLDGHAYDSWLTEDDDIGSDTGSMWLRHYFAEHFPNCRTMTYGYDAKLQNHGHHSIADYGRDLLGELEKARDTKDLRERPIIFIAHSFGGVFLVDSLVSATQQVKSNARPAVATLCKATYGLFLFGIPHRGLILDDVRQMLDSDNPRHKLLDDLSADSNYLKSQSAKFVNVVDTHDVKVASYYELLDTPSLAYDAESKKMKRKGSYTIAVDYNSAVLQLPDAYETKFYINADHSTMVKFKNMQDRTYKELRYRLRQFLDNAPKVVEARFKSESSSSGSPWGEGARDINLREYPPFSHPAFYPYGTFPADLSRGPGEEDTRITENDLRMIEDTYAAEAGREQNVKKTVNIWTQKWEGS